MADLPERAPRDRIVYATIQSVRERGVADTSLRDVVRRAQAPRGSLQHYFPGGKTQLMSEALTESADWATSIATTVIATMAQPTPGALFSGMCRYWIDQLHRYQFERGCPLVAAIADVANPDSALRQIVDHGFSDWQGSLRKVLRDMGVPAARARSLAVLMISALEGAIVVARSRHDTSPLSDVARELKPLLDSAVNPVKP